MTFPVPGRRITAMSASSTVEADEIPALGGWAERRAGVPGLPAVPAIRRRRQSKRVAEIAENAGSDENEVLEASRVTGRSLAETAETPCKYFARETVRSFTVSLGPVGIHREAITAE